MTEDRHQPVQGAPENDPPADDARAGPLGAEAVKEWLWAFAHQSADHAIVLLDTDSIAVWASPGASKVLGEDASAIVGSTLDRFFIPEDRRQGVPQHEMTVAASQGSADDNRWMMRGDQSRFWASGLMVSLRNAEGGVMGFIKILRNLTDMKMRIKTLENRGRALLTADADKNIAIATIAHELRNPLASMGMAAAMLRHLSEGEERLKPPVAILERNVQFSARLVDDLQDASRASAGRLDLKPERLLLHEVLQSAIDVAWHRAGEPARRADLLLPPGEPIEFEGDRMRIHQVFVNLVGNAFKYTREDGRIWVGASRHVDSLVVHVEDDGIGIAPEMLGKIFQMFSQAKTSMSHQGLGIGLALVKDIVELHGGTVQARSDGIGKGSDFVVRLPLRPATPHI